MLTSSPLALVRNFFLDLCGIPRPQDAPLKRKLVTSQDIIPSKCARIDSGSTVDPEVTVLNRKPIYTIPRVPMQSRENRKQSEEDECSIIAEIPRESSQTTRISRNFEKLKRSGLPPTRFNQMLAQRQNSRDSECDIILDDKPAPSQKRNSEDEIEIVKDRNGKQSKDPLNYRIFRTKRYDPLTASKTLTNNKRFELKLKLRRKEIYDSFRITERCQYEKLLKMQMGNKRCSIESSKSTEDPAVNKSKIPVIDLTDDKSQVRINRTRESIPQTSSAKSSENDIQIVEEIQRVRSLKDMLKVNPVDAEEVAQELLSRHSKLPPSSQELALLDEDSNDEEKKSKELDNTQNICDMLEEKFRNYMKITADEEPRCCVSDFTPKEEKKINSALVPHPAGQVLAKKFGLQITRRDMQTLKGLNWLNDEVINFYMQLIMERSKQKSSLPKVYAFNTFFYPKLMSSGHAGLKRWTKKVDLFSYDLILVPVHLGMHWCMATIDFRDKQVRYYDSMGSPNDRCLRALLYYLEAEYKDKKNKNFDTSSWEQNNVEDIPPQMNGSDCGVFSCMFAEHLARDAKIDFRQENMKHLRRKMVLEILEGNLLNS